MKTRMNFSVLHHCYCLICLKQLLRYLDRSLEKQFPRNSCVRVLSLMTNMLLMFLTKITEYNFKCSFSFSITDLYVLDRDRTGEGGGRWAKTPLKNVQILRFKEQYLKILYTSRYNVSSDNVPKHIRLSEKSFHLILMFIIKRNTLTGVSQQINGTYFL